MDKQQGLNYTAHETLLNVMWQPGWEGVLEENGYTHIWLSPFSPETVTILLITLTPWVARSQTRLSDFTFTFYFHALEKEMATHSSVLAWRIPGTGEPGGLPSMGSHRVRHD